MTRSHSSIVIHHSSILLPPFIFPSPKCSPSKYDFYVNLHTFEVVLFHSTLTKYEIRPQAFCHRLLHLRCCLLDIPCFRSELRQRPAAQTPHANQPAIQAGISRLQTTAARPYP